MWSRSGRATSLLRRAGLVGFRADPRSAHLRTPAPLSSEPSGQRPSRVFGRTRRARSRPANQAAAATLKDVKASPLRLDLGERLIARVGNVGGDDHKRTIDRQPKMAGDLPQAPLVEGSSPKQRVNQTQTL